MRTGKSWPFRCLLILAGYWPASPALAGPPLAIDDPGVLDPGQWEVIVAGSNTSIGEGHYYEAPLLDVSVGLVRDRIQVSATYRYAHADPEGDDSNWDFGNLEVGATLRLWENEKLQLALTPGYAFGVTRRLAQQGIGDAGDVAALPLVAQYQFSDHWRLNTQVGYEWVEDASDLWSYGAAVAFTGYDRWELMLELVGATNTEADNQALDVRAGFDFAIQPDFHLLFSVATGLDEASEEEELEYDVFLGLQFFF